jgi:hypothetical protein
MAYLTPAPGKGTFTTLTVGGTNVPAINQEKISDCAPSCVGLVLRMTKYKNADSITPAMLRAASQKSSGRHYRPAVEDVVGNVSSPLAMLGQIIKADTDQWRVKQGLDNPGDGTWSENIAATLRQQYNFAKAADQHGADLKSILRGATLANPYIVHVQWENGGGHWIACCGHTGAVFGHGSYLFSDPAYGAGWLEIPRADVGGTKQPTYIPAAGARGHLSGWYVSLN